MTERVRLSVVPAVPLAMRHELHGSGGVQESGLVWSVRWRGSGEWMKRLRDAGLIVTELDGKVPPRSRGCPALTFHVPDTVDLAASEARGGLR